MENVHRYYDDLEQQQQDEYGEDGEEGDDGRKGEREGVRGRELQNVEDAIRKCFDVNEDMVRVIASSAVNVMDHGKELKKNGEEEEYHEEEEEDVVVHAENEMGRGTVSSSLIEDNIKPNRNNNRMASAPQPQQPAGLKNPHGSGGPEHRPLVGGFAAAAYEAARVDYYKKLGKDVRGHVVINSPASRSRPRQHGQA